MDLKNIAKYGLAVGAGFVTGVAAEAASREILDVDEQHGTEDPQVDVWEGRELEWQFPMRAAQETIQVCDYNLDEGWWGDDVHYEQDIAALRRKFSHAVSKADTEGKQTVTVTLTDRERLVLYHINPARATDAANAPIKQINLDSY